MKKNVALQAAIYLIIILFGHFKVSAQPVCQIQHFSVYNGLAQRTVTNILQDSKGFIWFSTWNGLNKFDGYTFKNYKAFPGDGCTLTSNRILGIIQTQTCDIWCQTYDARLFLFDSRSEKFIDILRPLEKVNRTTYAVRKVYALPKGISWIVCDHEAFRIDERTCKNGEGISMYSLSRKNLPGEKILSIQQDSEGDEWILTDKGATIIGQKKITSDTPFKAYKENNNQIYLISELNKLAIYHPKTQKINYEALPFADANILTIHDLGRDTIGLGTDKGLYLFFANEKRYRHIDIRTTTHTSTKTTFVYKDKQGELWIFSDSPGIVRFNLITGEKQHFQTPHQELPSSERKNRNLIFEDNQGTLWVIPQSGNLSYYDRNSKQLKSYYTNYSHPETRFTPIVLNYFLDNQKNLWFTNIWDMTKMSFFPHACQLSPIDSGFETRSFLIDRQKNNWVATKKGFIRIFHPDGTLKGYLTPEGTISTQAIPFAKNIYCFLEDADGFIWMGSKLDGIFRLKATDNNRFEIKQFNHQPDNPYSLSNNSIYFIYQDSKKRIWIGSHGGGLNLLEQTPQGEIRFLHSGNKLKEYPMSSFSKVRCISEVNQTLLVGTTEGLLTFPSNYAQPEQIKFHQNIRKPDIASSLSSNDVTYIYTDSRKMTYVLTFTGGVNKIISKDLLTDHIEFNTYTTKDGLSSDLVLSMIEDRKGALWVISENALTKFDAQKETFENYGKRDFQEVLFFSEAAPVFNKQNQLTLGTDAGILNVTLDKLSKSTFDPPIVFTGLKIQGISQELYLDDLSELHLKPSERNVSFQFAALDYTDPTEIGYAYRLKGLEEKWNEVDNSRTASYINLPPGKYELQIRSTNSDGVWAENIRTLPVIVIPTFWETYWAWILYVLLFVLSTSVIVYIILYIYRLRHRINMEQQLANIKLRFFTDISHELRTPLTLIASPVTEVLEHETLSPNARKHLTLVHKNTERMLHLVNQILDFRKIENKKMKVLLEKAEVIGLLKQVMENFQLIAEEKNIDYQLQTNQEVINTWIDLDKFEKIVFNLLSNAFKYTPANRAITVHANVEGDKLIVSVADQGIGIDPKKQQNLFQRFETLVRFNILQPSSGIGLSLVKELIELHCGSIAVNSQPNEGSEFIITLPLDPKVYEQSENTEFILNDGNSTQTSLAVSSPITTEMEENSSNDKEEANINSISVLIVEDNPELRSFLVSILSETYKVIEATNGQEGLEYALQHIPDLIISDIMMPVMDGLDMVKSIKEDRDICHIPIILLSAKSSLDDRISGLEQGIDDYITKPFSATFLKLRIKSLLKQRKLLQEIYWKRWSENKVENPANVVDFSPSQPQITSFDEQFMQQVMQVMEEQMDNTELTIEDFANQLSLGRTVFYQKLKSIIGMSPVDFIREIRIKRAVQLIDSNQYNISQVAYMTGFNDPKYFSKCFKKQMEMTPTEYKDKTRQTQ